MKELNETRQKQIQAREANEKIQQVSGVSLKMMLQMFLQTPIKK
jgi:hypothetical protein